MPYFYQGHKLGFVTYYYDWWALSPTFLLYFLFFYPDKMFFDVWKKMKDKTIQIINQCCSDPYVFLFFFRCKSTFKSWFVVKKKLLGRPNSIDLLFGWFCFSFFPLYQKTFWQDRFPSRHKWSWGCAFSRYI